MNLKGVPYEGEGQTLKDNIWTPIDSTPSVYKVGISSMKVTQSLKKGIKQKQSPVKINIFILFASLITETTQLKQTEQSRQMRRCNIL